MHKTAVISDTHNLLRPEVLSILEGCEVILHAGDISTPEIYDRLQNIRTFMLYVEITIGTGRVKSLLSCSLNCMVFRFA